MGGALAACGRPPPGLLLPWLGLAAAALLLPWLLYAPLGLGDPLAALLADPVGALVPVLLGAAAAAALARWGGLLPTVPEGDILHLVGPAARVATAGGAAIGRAEAALRAWPAAGLALLALALLLAGIMLAAAR